MPRIFHYNPFGYGKIGGQADDGKFVTVERGAVLNVERQIAELDTQIIEAESEFKTASLDAAMNIGAAGMAETAMAALDQVDSLKLQMRMLDGALAAALEAERRREAQKADKAHRSKVRALNQHLSDFTRAVERLA